MMPRPLQVAIVGIGGFAEAHHAAFLALEEMGIVRVVATCDPAFRNLETQRVRYRLDARSVKVFGRFDTLLAELEGCIDLVSVASPIGCHADQHRACVERGLACYLEKPPTLDPGEFEGMIRVESRARVATQVGFNHIAQPWRLELKGRLLAGEFGEVLAVGFAGFWRRVEAYYTRNTWAGKLLAGNRLILDSCMGNAMAHHLHNLLFHAGSREVFSWACPLEVRSALYRGNAIQGADTIFASGVLSGGVGFRVAASHACESALDHVETIRCADALIEMPSSGPGRITRKKGNVETFPMERLTLSDNIQDYIRYLQGRNKRPSTTLTDCRPFVDLNALVYLAGGKIASLPESRLRTIETNSGRAVVIDQIEKIGRRFLDDGIFPASREFPGNEEGAPSRPADLPRLRVIFQEMAACATAPLSKTI